MFKDENSSSRVSQQNQIDGVIEPPLKNMPTQNDIGIKRLETNTEIRRLETNSSGTTEINRMENHS